MKENELMIGDWLFYYDNDECQNIPVKIISINDDGWVFYEFPDGIRQEGWCKNLYPIELTPEILEENGFMETDVVVVVARKMIWESEDGRSEITIWMDDTMPMHIRKNIYYEDEVCYTLPFACTVHELQHALRLCEIEKEISL